MLPAPVPSERCGQSHHRGRYPRRSTTPPLACGGRAQHQPLDSHLRYLGWPTHQHRDHPLALLWIALEALFGPEDAREITFRLSQRVALFLAEDRAEAKQLFTMVKKAYSFRSKIVHGRWKEEPDSLVRMAEVENLVRRSFGRILSDEAVRDTFVGNGREAYLDDLAFA